MPTLPNIEFVLAEVREKCLARLNEFIRTETQRVMADVAPAMVEMHLAADDDSLFPPAFKEAQKHWSTLLCYLKGGAVSSDELEKAVEYFDKKQPGHSFVPSESGSETA